MAYVGVIGRRVDKYDGQSIWVEGQEAYNLSNWLGGGAAGVVYEAVDLEEDRTVAIKILNPCGYKVTPSSVLTRCAVLRRGDAVTPNKPLTPANVWWLVQHSTRQIIAAYEDPQRRQFKELSLPKCIEIWGWEPLATFYGEFGVTIENEDGVEKVLNIGQDVSVDGATYVIPRVAPKFIKWLRARASIFREIHNMTQLGDHPNVVKFHEVLELVQDTKTTLFLVLELVTGGELFDRIKAGTGTQEALARTYFSQLLSGIEYCHTKGVCHRDLKPENLLLSDLSESAVLRIADFGLSAVFAMANDSHDANQEEEKNVHRSESMHNSTGPQSPAHVRRLRSVVGSPHYVAPEISLNGSQGYDGRKADSWSAGVILYAMLGGSLPFSKDLATCTRYRRFQSFIHSEYDAAIQEGREPVYPSWLFTGHVSPDAKALIVAMLHTDPSKRMSVSQAMHHKWLQGATFTNVPANVPSSSTTHTPSLRRQGSVNRRLTSPTAAPTPTQTPFDGNVPVPSLAQQLSRESQGSNHSLEPGTPPSSFGEEDIIPAAPFTSGIIARRLFETPAGVDTNKRAEQSLKDQVEGKTKDIIPCPVLVHTQFEQKPDESWERDAKLQMLQPQPTEQSSCK